MKSVEGKIAVISVIALAAWIFVVLPMMYHPWHGGPGTFWDLDGTAWTAIGALANVAYCLLTAGLLVFAIYQVLSTRRDAKINRTLAACDRYDIDPIIDGVARRISAAWDDGDLKSNPAKYKTDLYSIFNYFESIAIGVARGQYDADIVRDQLEHIMTAYVDDLILSDIGCWPLPIGGDNPDFDHVMKLYHKWKTPA